MTVIDAKGATTPRVEQALDRLVEAHKQYCRHAGTSEAAARADAINELVAAWQTRHKGA
jgi:hypothetical protein